MEAVLLCARLQKLAARLFLVCPFVEGIVNRLTNEEVVEDLPTLILNLFQEELLQLPIVKVSIVLLDQSLCSKSILLLMA